MQIGRVHIGITQHVVFGLMLAKAAIRLVFPVPPFPLITINSFIGSSPVGLTIVSIRSYSLANRSFHSGITSIIISPLE